MIYQMHLQNPKWESSQLVAQRAFKTDALNVPKGLYKWMNEVRDRHPCPDGCNWLLCDEQASEFVRAATPTVET